MRIADTEIPLVNGPATVLTNFAYNLGGVLLAGVVGSMVPTDILVLVLMVAVALQVVGFGSTLFHATHGHALWAQRMDTVGIQMVLTALIGLAFVAVTPVSGFVFAPLVFLGWLAWWYGIHRVRRLPAIGLQMGALLLMLWLVHPSVETGVITLILGMAVVMQRLSRTHGVWHAYWHYLGAIDVYLATYVLAVVVAGS